MAAERTLDAGMASGRNEPVPDRVRTLSEAPVERRGAGLVAPAMAMKGWDATCETMG